MPYLIDGNNLIGVFPFLEQGTQESRNFIIRKLLSFHHITGKRIILVFDGAPSYSVHRQEISPKNFIILFPSFGESADDVIKRNLKQGIILVSSDRELIEEARRRKLRWIRSRDFVRMLDKFQEGKREKPDWNPTPQEIDAWLKIFGEKR